MKINIIRNSTLLTTLPLSSSTFTKVLMGDHRLDFNIQTATPVDIQVGDTLEYRGELMTVNQAPEVTRNHLIQYAISFEGVRHTLSRFIIKDEGALTFDYTSDLSDFMFMFLESINSVDSGWTVGDLEVVEPFTVSFDKVDHLTALSMIAEACGCEWQMIGKEISIKKTVGQARAYPLAYGKDNGLYSIKRVSLENSKIVTRAYAVGGTENLPASYPHRQLTLPGYLEDATAVDLYGIREGVIEVPEVYPQRTSTATAVGQVNEATFTLTDTTIDFDLNGQRIDGSEAYIVFKSGVLNGQQFKILSYNNATKTIRYEANQDSNGGLLPSGTLLAEVGDQYTLIGIRMPESYVTAAFAELTSKREEYLNSNKVPRVVYEAALDPLDLRRNNVIIEEGDIIPFTDDKIGLDDNLRVTSVSYPALLPYQLTQGMTFDIEIGQEVTYTRIQKIEKDIKETKEVVTQVSKQSWENNRRNAVALREFMGQVFDPDGNMQEPLLQAIAAVFGTTSMYYDLHGITISVNAGGDENAVELTAGTLIHRTYEIAGLGHIWALSAFSQSGLDPLKSYYLSAKVSTTVLTGEWVLTEQQMQVDEEAGYWYFNFGVLSSVIEGVRSFRPTKLFTVISGGNIETDSISAYQIDVQRLFSQYIEAENFWLKIGKIGIFDVQDGYIQTSGWSDEGNSGVRFTNNGILSRNASQTMFPSISGIDWTGSLIGLQNQNKPSTQDTFGTYSRAGIVGINDQDMVSSTFEQMMHSYGHYGGLFSSIKTLGAVHCASRITEGSGSVSLTENDYLVVISGTHMNISLPTQPDNGRVVIVKNARNDAISCGVGGTSYRIIDTIDGTEYVSINISAYKYKVFQFVRGLFTNGHWIVIGSG